MRKKMKKTCKGCNKEFQPATPFIEFCENCLKTNNYKEKDKKYFEESYQEMCDYCAEIEQSMALLEEEQKWGC